MSIRLGIIGCGRFARRRLIPAILASSKCFLFGIQNRSLTKGKEIADQCKAKFYATSEKELIFHPEIDAIIICSLHHQHIDHLKLCAIRKIPTLCEKPLVTSYQEYLEIMDCFPKEVPLLVGHCYRFKDSLITTKRWIDEKKIGDLLAMDFKLHIPVPSDNWRYQKKYGGGVLLDIGIHIIDTAHFLSSQPIIESTSIAHFRRDAQNEKMETRLNAISKLEEKIPVTFSAAFDFPYETSFTIRGSMGRLSGEYTFRQVNDEKESLSFIDADDNMHGIPLKKRDIYEEQLDHFLSVINDRENALLNARDLEHNYQALDMIKSNLL